MRCAVSILVLLAAGVAVAQEKQVPFRNEGPACQNAESVPEAFDIAIIYGEPDAVKAALNERKLPCVWVSVYVEKYLRLQVTVGEGPQTQEMIEIDHHGFKLYAWMPTETAMRQMFPQFFPNPSFQPL